MVIIDTMKNIFGHVVVGRHACVKSGSRCWSSPGLLMFVTSPPPIRDGFSVIKYTPQKMVSVQTFPPLDNRSATKFGLDSSLRWLFSILGGISTAYLPR